MLIMDCQRKCIREFDVGRPRLEFMCFNVVVKNPREGVPLQWAIKYNNLNRDTYLIKFIIIHYYLIEFIYIHDYMGPGYVGAACCTILRSGGP